MHWYPQAPPTVFQGSRKRFLSFENKNDPLSSPARGQSGAHYLRYDIKMQRRNNINCKRCTNIARNVLFEVKLSSIR